MFNLNGKIALVTGASRGVGKGIALGLAEAGATVFVTARTFDATPGTEGLPGSVVETVREAERLGGRVVAVQCDHRDDDQVRRVFEKIDDEEGRLDILVNSVWGGYERMSEDGIFTWSRPFWEQPLWRWDAMFQAGVRAAYVASVFAAQRMVKKQGGLIVNISHWASQKLLGNVPYGVAKAATDKMTAYMGQELKNDGVAVVSLYPGMVKTERVMMAKDYFDLSNAESPQFIGRAVAALASDPHVIRRSTTVCVAASVARDYGFADVDGSQPKPLSLGDV